MYVWVYIKPYDGYPCKDSREIYSTPSCNLKRASSLIEKSKSNYHPQQNLVNYDHCNP